MWFFIFLNFSLFDFCIVPNFLNLLEISSFKTIFLSTRISLILSSLIFTRSNDSHFFIFPQLFLNFAFTYIVKHKHWQTPKICWTPYMFSAKTNWLLRVTFDAVDDFCPRKSFIFFNLFCLHFCILAQTLQSSLSELLNRRNLGLVIASPSFFSAFPRLTVSSFKMQMWPHCQLVPVVWLLWPVDRMSNLLTIQVRYCIQIVFSAE